LAAFFSATTASKPSPYCATHRAHCTMASSCSLLCRLLFACHTSARTPA
jgi:hypothetical protein